MDVVGQFAVDLLRDKIERTKRVLPNGKTISINADTLCEDLERIIAQIEAKDRNPNYEAPHLARASRAFDGATGEQG